VEAYVFVTQFNSKVEQLVASMDSATTVAILLSSQYEALVRVEHDSERVFSDALEELRIGIRNAGTTSLIALPIQSATYAAGAAVGAAAAPAPQGPSHWVKKPRWRAMVMVQCSAPGDAPTVLAEFANLPCFMGASIAPTGTFDILLELGHKDRNPVAKALGRARNVAGVANTDPAWSNDPAAKPPEGSEF
jgi:hypothetical protein